jgi:hypothetical protein
MEETMKALLGTAVAVAGMTVGASYANANTAIVGCEGVILLRNHKLATFPGASIEHQEITCAESGSNCKVDLRSGSQTTFNFGNTGLTCDLQGVMTQDWQEVISAIGQTTLTCKIH